MELSQEAAERAEVRANPAHELQENRWNRIIMVGPEAGRRVLTEGDEGVKQGLLKRWNVGVEGNVEETAEKWDGRKIWESEGDCYRR
jgi:hypothetical protein